MTLLGADLPSPMFTLLNSHRIPCVLMWAPQSDQGACVGFDEQADAVLVIDHLADQEPRQIGFIGGRTVNNERARRCFHGLLEAVAMRSLTLHADALMETDYGLREGFEAMQQILLCMLPVTAMVCGNDYLAAGALSALDRVGVSVPGRVSIVSFLRTLLSPAANDDSGADPYHGSSGRALPDPLSCRLVPESPALLPVELIIRDSTGPATVLAPKRSRKKAL